MTDDKEDGYIPWRGRIDKLMANNEVSVLWHRSFEENKIAELANQFITSVMHMGFAVTSLTVTWEEGNFKTSIIGKPLERKLQE